MTAVTITTPAHVHLISTDTAQHNTLTHDEILTAKAHLYGGMVARCQDVLHMYQSDLFHDAAWLTRRMGIVPGATFLWGFSDTHTMIDQSDVESMLRHNTHVYRITITVTPRGSWGATFDTLKAPLS